MKGAILIVTGDAGESFECLYARQRLLEAGWEPRIAAPSRRRLHLVIHDFEPGWDTYVERPGYGAESDLTFDEARVEERAAENGAGDAEAERRAEPSVAVDEIRHAGE